MKNKLAVIAFIFAIGLAIYGGRTLLTPKTCGAACEVKVESSTVSAVEFAQKSKEGDVVMLDVRTPSEFEQGHIKGARNIDFNNQTSFAKEIADLDKSKTYLVYCRSGNRSAQAQKMMQELGLSTVNLSGGIGAWQRAGLAIEKEY